MLEELMTLLASPLGLWEAVVRVGLSVVASAIASLIYQMFYGSRHLGAGVHEPFSSAARLSP